MKVLDIIIYIMKIMAYQQMNKFIRVTSSGLGSANKCYRVEHIKKLDYKQNIRAIIYFKNINS